MLRIVTSSSLKGGVGKTSIAVNTAGALQELGERCVVVDLDPQRSADRWAPEGLAVVTVENTKSPLAVKTKLAELAGRGATFAVLDTPPRRQETLVAAMVADVVLVPVTPSVLDIWPAGAAIGIACDAKSARDNGKPVIAMVPSQLFRNRLSAELPADLEGFGELVAPAIARRTAVAEAVLKSQTVTDYAPSSKAAQEFRALAQFVKAVATFQSQSNEHRRTLPRRAFGS